MQMLREAARERDGVVARVHVEERHVDRVAAAQLAPDLVAQPEPEHGLEEATRRVHVLGPERDVAEPLFAEHESLLAARRVERSRVVGEAVADKKVLENAVGDMQKIAGQKPVTTKARKSIAGFKIRDGYPIGCMVTLRGPRMFEFLDRLVTIALPRVRDFRGISGKSFDGQGNYNMGVKEQIIFPEIEYDKIDAIRGMNISITTTAKTDAEAKALLAAFKFPFRG